MPMKNNSHEKRMRSEIIEGTEVRLFYEDSISIDDSTGANR
jgi:hypothetical protein